MTLPYRKVNRLKEYDYSSDGIYFITICTENKNCILSRIVGDGVLDVPKIMMTKFGKIAEKQIRDINKTYSNIEIEHYVIMPNHIHFLVKIKHEKNDFFKNDSMNSYCRTSRTPSPTNMEIPKLVSTFKRFCNKKYGKNIWQRSYNDHIIRNEEDYVRHLAYINDNLFKWNKDEYYIIGED